jgi:hypothetical protein
MESKAHLPTGPPAQHNCRRFEQGPAPHVGTPTGVGIHLIGKERRFRQPVDLFEGPGWGVLMQVLNKETREHIARVLLGQRWYRKFPGAQHLRPPNATARAITHPSLRARRLRGGVERMLRVSDPQVATGSPLRC